MPIRGHISNGQRKLEYKTLRRDEHFFGFGRKRPASWTVAAKPTRCGTVTSLVIVPLRTRSTRVIPFFMSSYRYGIFLDNTYKTEFKFGTESRDYYSFEAPGERDDLFFIFGKGL